MSGKIRNTPEKFWSLVDKSGECWEWTGKLSSSGYGTFFCAGERRAHRSSWVMANGAIPRGMFVCHHCDNRLCVRPDHLFLGTPRDNILDTTRKQRAGKKLNPNDVLEIRRLLSLEVPQREIADRFGVNQTNISLIGQKKIWMYARFDKQNDRK